MNKLAFASIALISALSASADLATTRLAPVAAYAPDSSSKTSPTYVINGSGFNATAGTHGTSNGNGNSVWRSTSAAWFVVDLGKVYSVADVMIWNYNGSQNTNRGLRQIDVLFAVDESAYTSASALNFNDGKWVAVVSGHELAKASGVDTYAGESLALSSPKNARFIGIRIDTNYGGSERGLSEVRVDVVDETYSVSLDGFTFDASQMSATFTGTMTATDETDAEVFLAYGTEDAKMDLGTWENTVSCGTQASGDPFAKAISGLAADKTYYGALFVTNQSVASSWSETTNFITGVVSVRMPHDFCEAENFKRHIIFTRPASCAAEPLEISYAISGDAAADYASQLTGTAVFAAGATEVAVELTPVKDTESPDDKTLTVKVQPGLYVTDATSVGSVTVLDTSSVSASNPSWTGYASTMEWNTAGNWSSLKVPNYLDTVTIDAACSAENPVLSSGDEHLIRSLVLGTNAGDLGALGISGRKSIVFSDEARIGAKGDAYLSLDDGAQLYFQSGVIAKPSGALQIGMNQGSSVRVEVGAGARLTGSQTYIGNSGSVSLVMGEGSRVATTGENQSLNIGYSAGSCAVVTNNGGTLHGNYHLYSGVSGTGIVYQTAGIISNSREMVFGQKAGSCGKLFLKGGSLSCAYQLRFGEAGYGEGDFEANATFGRGLGIGRDTSSVGIVRMGAVSVSTGEPGGTHGVYVGESGHGELYLSGTSFTITKASPLSVAKNDGSFGIIRGWGDFKDSRSQVKNFTNNGLVVADGNGSDRDLTFATKYYLVKNTIDNKTTNGWYAANGGRLTISSSGDLAVGDSVAINWCEDSSDTEIDLINSVRFVFSEVSNGGAILGKLYAPDRSDVPRIPGGREAVGVWKFDITGAYQSATVEFRYDHVKAPRGVQMYQLNEDGATWAKLDTELLGGYRARVAVTDASRMFAARANHDGLTIVVR